MKYKKNCIEQNLLRFLIQDFNLNQKTKKKTN